MSARRCCARGPATSWRRSPTATSSAARTSSSSTAARSRSTPTARSWPGPRRSREELLVCERRPGRGGRRAAARHAAAARVEPPAGRARRGARARRRRARGAPGRSRCRRSRSRRRCGRRSCSGSRDYAAKNGFQRALLGLSGGIDSALVAALAADALGPDRVDAISMPSRYNVAATRSDARRVAEIARRSGSASCRSRTSGRRSRPRCPMPPGSRPRTCRPGSAA